MLTQLGAAILYTNLPVQIQPQSLNYAISKLYARYYYVQS